jgi:quinohemoprotein ethanol dehydrogenase
VPMRVLILRGLILSHILASIPAANQALAARSGEWPEIGGDKNGTFYSPLKAINDSNVKRLGFAWEFRTGTQRGLEATPLVVDGVMYTSGNWGVVYALNPTSGKLLWSFDPRNNGQSGRNTCCDVVNRGVALANNRVFVASTDGRLFALQAQDGKRLWDVDTFVDREARSSTGAPQCAGDLVLIGNSGGDLG